MIGIPVGIVYANAAEWLIHKHILHGLGRHKDSFWAFHWHEHHKASRKSGEMHDEQYEGSWVVAVLSGRLDARAKEALSLLGAAAVHAPLLPVAPFFALTVWASAANYYRVHKRSHLDWEWAKQHLPWHVDHHMGKDQDQNWCVTWPLMDWVMKTRQEYVGTERFVEDEKRRAEHRAQTVPPSTKAREARPVLASTSSRWNTALSAAGTE